METKSDQDEPVLRNAKQIAEFVFGEDSKQNRRRIYYAADKGYLAVRRVGKLIQTTRAAARAYMEPPTDGSFAAGE
ncbi:MAG: hypothetical protein KIS96_01160 [Bauldia sp.]|nr:hypothetical protein [Bauldia sp.]